MFEEVPVKASAKEMVSELKEGLSPQQFHDELKKKDPTYAEKIHYNDQYRVGRALELILSLGKTMEQINEEFAQKKQKLPYPSLFIGMKIERALLKDCLLYTSPSPRDKRQSRMPSSA